MRLSMIAAVSSNGVIGAGNRLPWKLPADLRRFKRLTMGHYLLMGRKTFESIGRPLPGRTTVVITHRQDYAPSGVLVAHTMEEALEFVRADDEAFVAGGAQIYQSLFPRAERLYLTRIEKEFEGDVHFPDPQWDEWELVEREEGPPDEETPLPYAFLTYRRRHFA